jgi:hypothetical protein
MDITFFKQWWFIGPVIILAVWDSVWKLVALWRAARNNLLPWFVCLAIFNTLGILPMIYVLVIDKKKKEVF